MLYEMLPACFQQLFLKEGHLLFTSAVRAVFRGEKAVFICKDVFLFMQQRARDARDQLCSKCALLFC